MGSFHVSSYKCHQGQTHTHTHQLCGQKQFLSQEDKVETVLAIHFIVGGI